MTIDLKGIHDIAPEAFDNAAKNLTDEPSKFLGHTGKSILSICFDGINYYAERLDLKRKTKLEIWKSKAFVKLNEIPIERRMDPPLHIAGPIVEASKFYFEDDCLSELFSNLLASSCDTENLSSVHPAFIEMLKQMSPLDAKIMQFAKCNGFLPLASYRVENEDSSGIDQYTNVFYMDGDAYSLQTIEDNSASITNLLRLKLIDSYPGTHLTDDSYYESFRNDPTFENLPLESFSKRELKRRYAFITALGEKFIKCCIND